MWTLENISHLLNKEAYIYSSINILKQYGLTEVSGQSAEDPTIQMCYNSHSNFIPHLADLHDNHLQMDENLSEKIAGPFVTDAFLEMRQKFLFYRFFALNNFAFLKMSYAS